MDEIDRGQSLILEVEVEKYVPYGSYGYIDPTTLKITVTDRAGTKKVDAAALLPLDPPVAGKYWYKVQTTIEWLTGKYTAKVDTVHETDVGLKITPAVFYLK